jgi:uncharacterized protein
MELTEHKPGNHHVVLAVTSRSIRVNQTTHTSSLILGARYLEADWPVSSLADLNASTLAALVAPKPELVIIGVGQTHQVLDLETQRFFIQHGIGIESMTLAAAARTFNVLMSENRRALAGFILEAQEPMSTTGSTTSGQNR